MEDLLRGTAQESTLAAPVAEEEPADSLSGEAGAVPCTYHPRVQTVLRCNRCSRPICPRCAVLTEVGYRCPDCIRGQESAFFNVRWGDYPVAVLVSGAMAALAAVILSQTGLFIALFLSPVAGGLIARVARQAVGRRRGRYMWLAGGGAAFVGGALGVVLSWLLLGPISLLAAVAYLVLCTATAVGALR